MEDRVKEKLNDLLRELPFAKEQQVVYFFVETRKLLDRIDQQNRYTYIRFFCDWILHTEKTYHLDVMHDDFDKIAADIEIQAQKSITQLILDANRHPFAEFASFTKLREELASLLSEEGINDNLTTENDNWFSLRNLLFRVLADQKIDFGNNPVRGIKFIEFREVKKYLYGCILVVGFIEKGAVKVEPYIFVDDKPNFEF